MGKLKFLNTRGGAVIAAVLLVALSVLFGSHRSLSALYDKVYYLYETGEGGFSVRADLDARCREANNLITIAEKYLSPDSAEIKALSAVVSRLAETKDLDEAKELNRLLGERAGELEEAIWEKELSDRDISHVTRIATELDSSLEKIKNSEYNVQAGKFNNILSGFPAGFLGGLTAIRPAPIFK